MQIVPFSSNYDQTFTCTLNGTQYVIDARWNERGAFWTFDLTENPSQTLLVAGVPLLLGQDVLAPYALGIGGLIMADLANSNTDAGPEDLSDRVVAVFFTPAELSLLVAAGVAGIAAQGGAPASTSSPATSGGSSSGGSGGGSTQTITTLISQTISNLTMVGGGFGSDKLRSDGSGTEVIAYVWPVNAGLNPNPTLKAIAALILEGSGTVRMYVGGTLGNVGDVGTPSGTLVGSAPAGGARGKAFISGTPVTNPGGLSQVTITLQSTNSSISVQVDTVNGALG